MAFLHAATSFLLHPVTSCPHRTEHAAVARELLDAADLTMRLWRACKDTLSRSLDRNLQASTGVTGSGAPPSPPRSIQSSPDARAMRGNRYPTRRRLSKPSPPDPEPLRKPRRVSALAPGLRAPPPSPSSLETAKHSVRSRRSGSSHRSHLNVRSAKKTAGTPRGAPAASGSEAEDQIRGRPGRSRSSGSRTSSYRTAADARTSASCRSGRHP